MYLALALRNITRNKKNSALVTLLIAVITFLFFIGNTVIGRADRSMRDAYIDSLTGEVVIQKTGEITMNLFGANTPVIDEFFTIPVLPAHDAIMELAAADTAVDGITSQVSGKALLDMMGIREPVLLCGVDVESYFRLFPGIRLEEGRLLRAGEYGAMITVERAERIARQTGERPALGTPLLLTSGGAAGFRIREVPLIGIYRYQNPGPFMSEIIIIDPQTVRALNSIQTASAVGDLSEETMNLFSADMDDLFGAADTFSSDDSGEGFSIDALQSFLSETGADETNNIAGGDWNFIILRLKKGASPGTFISALNKKIAAYGATAISWRLAAGTSAIMLILIQGLFNAGVFLVSVAGVITVINILLISVFRRGREIGTLRAIGASDSYIRLLVLGENLLLALAAGFAGVLGGMYFLRRINGAGIVIRNDLIAALLGGHVLRFEFLPGIAALSFAAAAVLGIAASIYPVETAVRIEPVSAVRRG